MESSFQRVPPKLRRKIESLLRANDELPLRFHDGDVRSKGSFVVGEERVVVAGNLRAGGCLVVGEKADHSLLVVLGDLHVRDAALLSYAIVVGRVVARGVIYGSSLGNDSLVVGGSVSAKAIIDDGHWFEVNGPVSAKARIDGGSEDLDRFLVPAVLAKEEGIDSRRMAAALRAGREVLLKRVRPAAQPAEKTKAKATLALDGKNVSKIPTKKLKEAAEKGLRALTLVKFRLRTVPKEVCEMATLDELDLSYNELDALPKEFTQLEGLRVLDLCGNRFELRHAKALAAILGALPQLRELYLGGNPGFRPLVDAMAKLLPRCRSVHYRS